MALVYADIKRYLEYTSKWNPGPIRWMKMAMKVLKLHGGEGGLREPYRMPPEDELQEFTDGLLRLGARNLGGTDITPSARSGLPARASPSDPRCRGALQRTLRIIYLPRAPGQARRARCSALRRSWEPGMRLAWISTERNSPKN